MTNEAFEGLVEAIRADVDLLNQEKAGIERFAVRSDDRTTLEFYKIGQTPETRLTLTPEPETGSIKYDQMFLKKRRNRKGRIEVSTNANGKPRLAIQRLESSGSLEWDVSYQELSQFLLDPTF